MHLQWGNRGGLCEYSFYICTRQKNEQNWGFSQPICMMHAKEIILDVTYNFDECSSSFCDDNFLTLFSTQQSSVVNTNQRRDTSNYLPLGGEKSKLQGKGSKTFRIQREDQASYLYLALKDTGTCGEISRMIAYYQVCEAKQIGLVRYPEFASPPHGTTETFLATCACNAHPVTNMEVTATSDGQCVDVVQGGARCQCDAGYVLSQDGRSCNSKILML